LKGRKKEVSKDILDLTGITKASATDVKYICKDCQPEQILMAYPQAQIDNPFVGPSYRCQNCNTVYDSSLVKLPRAARLVRSTIGNERDSQMDFVVDTVPENKGLQSPEDEYDEKYNPEPMEDERLEMEGAHIINSTTYYPASNTTITKRSLTPQEIAEERGYSLER